MTIAPPPQCFAAYASPEEWAVVVRPFLRQLVAARQGLLHDLGQATAARAAVLAESPLLAAQALPAGWAGRSDSGAAQVAWLRDRLASDLPLQPGGYGLLLDHTAGAAEPARQAQVLDFVAALAAELPGVPLLHLYDRQRVPATMLLDCARLSPQVAVHGAVCGNPQWVASTAALQPPPEAALQRLLQEASRQHAAQVAQQRGAATLRESEARYRGIFLNSSLALFRAALSGFLEEANSALARLFGYASPDDLQRVVAGLDQLFANEARRSALVAEALAARSAARTYAQMVRRDGSTFVARVSLQALRDELGAPVCLHGFLEDVTERLAAETALQDSELRHRRRGELLSEVVGVADELLQARTLRDLCRRAVELARERLGVARGSLYLAEGNQFQGTWGTALDGATTDESELVFTWQEDWRRVAKEEEWTRQYELTVGPRTEVHGTRIVDGPTGWIATTLITSGDEPIGVFFNDAGTSDRPPDPDVQEVLQVYCSLLGQIIERRRATEALQASEARHRVVLAASPDAITFTDRDGRVLVASPRAVELCGLRHASDLVGRAVLDFIAPEDQAAARVGVEAMLSGGQRGRTTVYTMLRPDGARRTVEISAAPYRDPDGQVAGFCSVSRDITARVAAAERLRLLSAVIEQSEAGVVITAADYRVCYVNAGFERLTGWTAAEVLGRRPSETYASDLFPVEPNPADLDEPVTRRVQRRRRNGELYWEDLTLAPLRDAAGQITNLFSLKRDVTREVALDEALRQTGKLHAVGQLAGGVAHEFNNLLTAITGYTDFVIESLDPQDERVRDLQAVRQAARRGADLTTKLLNFSRRQLSSPRLLDVNEVIRELRRMFESLLGESSALQLDLAPDLWPVLADHQQLDELLTNLVLNAHEALVDGGTLTIQTANVLLGPPDIASRPALRVGPHVVLRVADTGRGMDDATRRRIFEPFFSTHGPTAAVGLGLAAVYGAVQRCGGQIECASELGSGTTITIHLPAAERG
ncbi:MAG: PAS domain S-box protein [Fimbriimonadaceae bacterium]|nr:PAS domain S-box protein [Fimbriimonadaceae bacterium]